MLSIHNYESAHLHLPPAAGLIQKQEGKFPETTKKYSGFLSFFQFAERYSGPFFHEESEHDGIKYPAYPDVDSTGYPLWTEQRGYNLCPSLPEPNSEFGAVHYALSIGDVAKNVHTPNSIRGAFAVGLAQTFDDITDGTSNTIGLTEIGGLSERATGRRFAINQPAKFLENPSLASQLGDGAGRYKSSVELGRAERGGNWSYGTGGPGLVNTVLPPGSPSLLVGGDSQVDGFFSASINHSGGLNVALCDGSTHFVSADIDVGNQQHPTASAEELMGTESQYGIWGGLGSCNGNETIAVEF